MQGTVTCWVIINSSQVIKWLFNFEVYFVPLCADVSCTLRRADTKCPWLYGEWLKLFLILSASAYSNLALHKRHLQILQNSAACIQRLAVKVKIHYHRHHLPLWIRSFDLFRYRRIAIVSWGVHDLFFLEVCSWGRVSGVWCCPFFQGGWSSFVCISVSRLVFQRSLVLYLWLRFLFYSTYLSDKMYFTLSD